MAGLGMAWRGFMIIMDGTKNDTWLGKAWPGLAGLGMAWLGLAWHGVVLVLTTGRLV